MSGTVNITRDLWDDAAFKDAEMSQREAWIWLIAQASWKKRVKRVGANAVELDRGQLAVSTRFLAAAWMWSEPRVRRYLDMLENRRMISRVTDAGVTVVTICNYDKYQTAGRVADAAPTQQPTQERRTTDANQNKGEIKGNKEEEGACAREAFFDRLRRAANVAELTAYWTGQSLADAVSRWAALGLSEDQIIAAAAESRKKNPSPPDGPKALDRWMEATAKAAKPAREFKPKATATPTATTEISMADRVRFWAEKINSDTFVPSSCITPAMARAMIDQGLVDASQLRTRGIAA
jgi:hypothetical protein